MNEEATPEKSCHCPENLLHRPVQSEPGIIGSCWFSPCYSDRFCPGSTCRNLYYLLREGQCCCLKSLLLVSVTSTLAASEPLTITTYPYNNLLSQERALSSRHACETQADSERSGRTLIIKLNHHHRTSSA